MALQSQLFSGDRLLEDAAVADPAHIVQGARGPHVAKIQQALIELSGAAIKADGIYGPATAAAVAEFKRNQRPPILNFEGKIDNIVGIKTMAALDAALPKGGGPSLNFGIKITFVDIVVNFIGAAGTSQKFAEDALPLEFISSSYDPVKDPKDRKLLRHKKNGNLLFRIAQNTNEIGPASTPILLRVLLLINNMLNDADPENGNPLLPDKILILGSSSGGRTAIDFAGVLVQSGFRPTFVAAIDASFFQADTADRPKSTAEPVEPIPTFKLRAASPSFFRLITQVPKRHNFFQRRGNHAKASLNPFSNDPRRYTSNMDGGIEEIHGFVEDFEPHEVKVGSFGSTDEKFHDECDVTGRREAQQMIAKELRDG